MFALYPPRFLPDAATSPPARFIFLLFILNLIKGGLMDSLCVSLEGSLTLKGTPRSFFYAFIFALYSLNKSFISPLHKLTLDIFLLPFSPPLPCRLIICFYSVWKHSQDY